jgi:hypothetical protein
MIARCLAHAVTDEAQVFSDILCPKLYFCRGFRPLAFIVILQIVPVHFNVYFNAPVASAAFGLAQRHLFTVNSPVDMAAFANKSDGIGWKIGGIHGPCQLHQSGWREAAWN